MHKLIILASLVCAAVLIAPAMGQDQPATGPAQTQPAEQARREPPPPPRGHQPLSAEQEQKLLDWLQQRYPEQHARLLEVQKTNPQRYQWALRATHRWYERLRDLPPNVQEALVAEQQARTAAFRIARELRDATDDQQRQQLMQQLRETTARLFNAEQKVREHRLQQLEQEIQRLKEELLQRRQQREELVEERVRQMLEEPPTRRERSDGAGEP